MSLLVQYTTPSVIFPFICKNAWQAIVSSTVILEMQAAWNLPSATVLVVAVVQLPCQLNRAAVQPGVQVRQ